MAAFECTPTIQACAATFQRMPAIDTTLTGRYYTLRLISCTALSDEV
jgi:hypothetical protein